MTAPNVSDWERAALVCREVAELTDDDNPDLNPDEMIVTGDELQPIVAAAIAEVRRETVERCVRDVEHLITQVPMNGDARSWLREEVRAISPPAKEPQG